MKVKYFLTVIDNFYEDPLFVYNYALQLKYYQLRTATGFRSEKLYQETGLRKRFEKLLRMKINRWNTDQASENGIFFYSSSKGTNKETPGVHSDEPTTEVTAVVYLTPDLPHDCGTSFWKHKQTKLFMAPTRNDAKTLKMPIKKVRQILDDDSVERNKWEELDKVSYKFNRLVAFPSAALHSATRHYGDLSNNGRITQTFRIDTDWATYDK